MNFDNLKISDFIEAQLPNFIAEEYPKFVNFFQEYYKSLEIPGGILDISNNFTDYIDTVNLYPNYLVANTTLASGITSSGTTISATSVEGFAENNGIILIDSEIIFYQSLDKQNKKFLNCTRGYSAVKEYKDIGTKLISTTAASHNSGATIKNLSNLFSFAILKHYQNQYLKGFPYTEVLSEISEVTLIENIKEFYQLKGTSVSLEFLFRVIYNQDIIVRYPRDWVIKPSTSDWTVDDIIKVESIKGSPVKLIGEQIYQTDKLSSPDVSVFPEPVVINNVSSYFSGPKEIFELRLNILNFENFKVPSRTFLRKSVLVADTTITVDSTLGFDETNGVIQIGNELIFYKNKSYNQFFQCSRGYSGTTPTTHINGTELLTTEYLYGYSNGDKSNPIEMRLLGMVSSIDLRDGGVYYTESDTVDISPAGVVDIRPQFQGWRINETGEVASSSVLEYRNVISKVLNEVQAVYKDDDYVYIASAGLPKNSIGGFDGLISNLIVGNQYHLKRIPLKPDKATEPAIIGTKGVGIFKDGVQAYSAKDFKKEIFGDITSVTIIDGGFGFTDSIKPRVRVVGGNGSEAVLSATSINGKITEISVISGGTNFTSNPTLEIAYGFDATAAIVSDGDINQGTIQKITVVSGGTQYNIAPEVQIFDSTGRGKGAYAVAVISGGTVTRIDVLTGGLDYNNKDTIVVSLVSPGRNVSTIANVRQWNYDRTFTLNNTFNTSIQKWEPASTKKTDANNGYLFNGLDDSFGLEYAYPHNPKAVRLLFGDNVQGAANFYAEVTGNYKHSPILGWAYDGHPIYGPYGYADPTVPGNVKRLESSYKLRNPLPSNRPNSTNYPGGSFVEDYQYVSSYGDLDIHNGRFCITPEYPEGTYAYFLTIDSVGEPAYPYIIGPTYNSIPASANFLNQYRQSEEFFPPLAKRLRTANTPSDGYETTAEIARVDRGSVTTFLVKESQSVYKNGDFIYFDNDGTEGSGAYATVNTVTGQVISGVTNTLASGVTASGAAFYVGSNTPVFPDLVSAPAGSTLKYDVFVTTNSGHSLVTGDEVYVNTNINAAVSERTFKVRVTEIQIINYIPPSKTTALTVGINFNETLLPVISVTGFSIDDYIKVNDEIMQIQSINGTLNELTVIRPNTQKLHSGGDTVSLYIPDSDFDYRLNLGQSISAGGASGTITKLDKVNKQIEIKLSSTTNFSSSAVIYDNSLPIPPFVGAYDGRKQLNISSISTRQIYWEIDPTNVGTFYTRNLSGIVLSKGNRYIFDVSDASNGNYTLSFSEDANNNIGLYNIKRLGVPGNAGAKIVVSESNFTLLGLTRIYYYELNGLIPNYKTYFDIKVHAYEGLYKVVVLDSLSFKYTVSRQPEPVTFSGVSYYTYSQTAVGKINSILNIDGGKNYKKLPVILGITHIETDKAEFTFNISSGKIISVFVSKKGDRYSSNTILKVISTYGGGAILTPTITNGKITNVTVNFGGTGYTPNDTKIIAIDKSNTIIPISDNIGKIKSVRITNTGNQLNVDSTLAKTLDFGYNLIVSTNFTSFYGNGEILQSSTGAKVTVIRSYRVNDTCYFVKVKVTSGILLEGDNLTGNSTGVVSKIEQIEVSSIFTIADGYSKRFGYYASDWGKLNSFSQKITDSYFYQDFSYVIRSELSTNDYKDIVYKSTHPAGFKLFGEVGIENNFEAKMNSEVNRITEVSILSNILNVESIVEEQQVTVSILNTQTLTAIDAKGSALNDVKNKELDIKIIDDISTYFSQGTFKYNLYYLNDPLKDLNQFDGVIAVNEIFQEPTEYISVADVTASGNVLTVTTPTDHNYAQIISGVTYPLNQYIALSGLTPSYLNTVYEIFGVPTSNSFTVLFNNIGNLSGVVSSGTTKTIVKGEYYLKDNYLSFVETPKIGSTFYGVQYRFVDGANTSRYCYKVKNILFDGITSAFYIRKLDGTIVTTDPDENLLVFLDGILQNYGTSYTIDRDNTSPNYRKLIFTTPPAPEKKFFAYSFSKYKVFDDISSEFNGGNVTFNIKFNLENFKISVPEQLMVVLDGVPQIYGTSYTIKESILTFKEPPTKGKECKLIFFYGKTFDKKFYIYNQDVYSSIVQTTVNDEGCPVYNALPDAYTYITPGDKLQLAGESPKELILFENNIVETAGTKEYIALIYNDDSFVTGKNGVATAVLSGIQVASGIVTSGIGRIEVNNGGVGYDVAPIVVFKSTCDNPGKGASAKVNVKNGVIDSIDVISTGSGYTKAPEVIITKSFKIIRNQYPVYSYENTQVTIHPDLNTANLLSVINEVTRTKTIPTQTLVDATANILVEFNKILLLNTGLVDDAINPNSVNSGANEISTDATALKLGVKLINFFENRFAYQPGASEGFATNNGLTVGQLASYMPALTLQDVIDRPGSEKGADFSDPSYNFGLDSYVTFGTTLASGVTESGTTIYLASTAGFRGNHNYFRYSEKFEESSWIRTNSSVAVDLFLLSPTGFKESDVIIATMVSGQHGVYQDYDYAISGMTYTLSVYAQKGGFDYLKMTMSGATDYGFTYFNLDTALAATTANQTIRITPTVGNWYRYSVTQTAHSNGKIRCGFYVHSADNEGDWVGDNIMGVFAWGAQMETNPQARIYIRSESTSSSDYNFPIFIGNELIRYTTISGNVLLNCTRGPNAYSHSEGDYVRVAWED